MKKIVLFLLICTNAFITNAQLNAIPYVVWNDPSTGPFQEGIRSSTNFSLTPITYMGLGDHLAATQYIINSNGWNWYKVDIPNASSSQSGYVRSWYQSGAYLIVPSCYGKSLVSITTSPSINIRTSASASASQVTISGSPAKVWTGQKFVLTGNTASDATYQWREIYLPDNCSPSTGTGWIAISQNGTSWASISTPSVNPLPSPTLNTPNSTQISSNSINFSWSAVPGATGYVLSVGSNTYSSIYTTNYTATGLNSNTLYNASVYSFFGGCASPNSNTVSPTTLNTNTTPGTPTNLVATPTGQTSANLSWSAGSPVGSPVVSYSWAVMNTANLPVVQGNTTGLSATTNALTCGTSYTLKVYATTSSNGTSSPVATSTSFTTTSCPCIPPSTPITPTSNSPQTGNVTITRGTPPSGVTWYWQGTNANGTSTSSSAPTYNATTTGTYYLRAHNGTCWSTNSASVNVVVNSVCSNSATISANTTSVAQGGISPIITFTGAGGTAPYTFTYNINGGGNIPLTTTSGNSKTLTVPTSTVGTFVYNLVTITDANCTQAVTGSVTITVNTPPSQIRFYTKNSRYITPQTLESAFTNNLNPTPVKICADGSGATFIEFYNNTGLPFNNIGFQIHFDEFGLEPEKYGWFSTPITISTSPQIYKATFFHPSYMNELSIHRKDTIEIYNTLNGSIIYKYPIEIYRAPLLCVHGLGGGTTTFTPFKDYAIDNSMYPCTPNMCTNNYNKESPLIHLMEYLKYESFFNNKHAVELGINDLFEKIYVGGNKFSAGKVDIVAHSMGGIVSRLYIQNPYNINNHNYRYDVHKLITVNTPHSGSQLADYGFDVCASFVFALAYTMGAPSATGAAYNLTCGNISNVFPALWDLRVNSNEIDDKINGDSKINNSLVPTFAITTKDNLLFNDPSCNILAENIATFSPIFLFQDHDDIVAVSSQQGGISPSISTIPHVCHIGSTQDPTVQQEIRFRINSGINSTYFDIDGYSPPNLVALGFPSNQGNQAPLSGSASVNFTSPTYGATFNSGGVINITAIGSTEISQMSITIGNEFILPKSFKTTGNTLTYSYQIPNNVIGELRMIVFGMDSSNDYVFDTLRINIGTTSTLDSITTAPATITVNNYQKKSFEVIGHYSDGITRTLSHIPNVLYTIADTNIAIHTYLNEVQGKLIDTTQMTISYVGVSKTVDVIVIDGSNYLNAGFLGDDTTICAGDIINFTSYSTGIPTNIAWQFNGGTPSTSTSENPSVLYNTPGIYDVRLIATYPSKIDTLIMTGYVTVNSLPTIGTSTTASTICQGTSTSLTATGVNTYTWMPGALSGATISVTPTSSTTYTVTGTNANGCVNTATRIITVNPTTTNGSAIINACNSYLWNGVTYTISGNYTYTSINGQGCTNIATLDLTVNTNNSSSVSVTACNAYTWTTGNGATYTSSGVYTNSVSIGNGCYHVDSLVLIINNGQWTWKHGGNGNFYESTVYGTLGNPASINKPGARINSVTWKDNSGNLWLFGGHGLSTTGWGYFNDLWRFDPLTNQWTWINGSNNISQLGVYGTLGISASSNKPGARSNSVTWTDGSGNLWLFGGHGLSPAGYGYFNDLWKYNISINQWTWMGGSNTRNEAGNFGSNGIPNILNKPGARQDAVSWVDNLGNLWIFGGEGYGNSYAAGFGTLNDLWKYNISTGQWTWMSGDNTISHPGVYGTLGASSISNFPSTRAASISWSDNSGNLWLFGGWGLCSTYTFGYLNDLWKYNTSIGQWTWVGGSNSIDELGVYGVKGVPSVLNKPGARNISTSWSDNLGNLYLFGGMFWDGNRNNFDDLWKYNISTGMWTWIGGSNSYYEAGVYGTLGVPSNTNKPGARESAVSWVDNLGNLWLWGGETYLSPTNHGYVNDLWKYTPTSCPTNLDIKLYLQGYYTGSGLMASTLKNEGVGNNSFVTDSIDIELHSSNSPYQVISSASAILKTNGTLTCSFPYISGSYYIVVKHRNGIETWSATPVPFGEAQTIYDFSNNSSNAYGNNMSEVSTGVWAIYTGDLNYDENIDLLDVSDLEFGINAFNFGYHPTDLNGDGNVDLLDAPILEANVNNFIFSNHP